VLKKQNMASGGTWGRTGSAPTPTPPGNKLTGENAKRLKYNSAGLNPVSFAHQSTEKNLSVRCSIEREKV
jgi:hypothetical protein